MRDALRADEICFDKLYSSPLVRATETASIILSDPAKVIIDDRLIEIDAGTFDGRLEEEISESIGKIKYDDWRSRNFILSAPGGESISEVMTRVEPLLNEVSRLPQNTVTGFVAHQGSLMAVKAVISGESSQSALAEFKQKNDEIEVWDLSSGKCAQRIRILE